MRKLFARNTFLTVLLTALFAGSLFAAQACTAGEGASPTCKPDVDENGNQRLPDGCNKFAVCRAEPLNEKSPQLPAEECCKDSNGPFQGQLLKLCLYGYGEEVDFDEPSGSSASGGDGGGGGGGGSSK